MSNTYIIHDARIVADPAEITIGGNTLTKLRVADNPISKERNTTRYVEALVGGRNAQVASRLRTGDVVTLVGTLVQREYTSKGGGKTPKGTIVKSDEMPFVDQLKVQKSPSFFGAADAPTSAPSQEQDGFAPADPTDDLPF